MLIRASSIPRLVTNRASFHKTRPRRNPSRASSCNPQPSTMTWCSLRSRPNRTGVVCRPRGAARSSVSSATPCANGKRRSVSWSALRPARFVLKAKARFRSASTLRTSPWGYRANCTASPSTPSAPSIACTNNGIPWGRSASLPRSTFPRRCGRGTPCLRPFVAMR